jgi:hypothetical protein
MSQFPHDQFAKDLLESLLSPLGQIETDRQISGEVRRIDVCFSPAPQAIASPDLGLLGRLASTGAAFEPFRNPVTPNEIRSCLSKLLDWHAELRRQAQRQPPDERERLPLPQLWILTPTLAATTLKSFGAITDVAT